VRDLSIYGGWVERKSMGKNLQNFLSKKIIQIDLLIMSHSVGWVEESSGSKRDYIKMLFILFRYV
jgi:hypothetical protein